MMRLNRVFASLTIACCLLAPASWSAARADDTTTPPVATPPAATPSGDNSAAPAPTPAPTTDNPAAADSSATTTQPTETAEPQTPPTLDDLVDTYWHYGKVARYDLAADAGQKILDSGSDSSAILMSFEAVVGRHNDSLDTWMLRWKSIPVGDAVDHAAAQSMRQVTAKLNDIINEGYAARRSDPKNILQTVIAMSDGSRAYDNNLPRLTQSGEVAVKIVLDVLRDPQQAQYHDTCRRILRDLGRKALNPLLAATEMKDFNTLVDVISALGDLGYDAAIPYLARLAVAPEVPDAIHDASRKALYQIGLSRGSPVRPSDLFFNLAEKCYYGRSDIPAAGDKNSYIWYWTDAVGLARTQVPTPIFNDLLAMRACEYTLKLDPSSGRAVSLWLAANTKRECDLPTGAVDLTHKGDPDANYYNVSAGANYLNDALARAIHDRNPAVALKLCQSLRDITGLANLNSDAITPLMQALYFPNRQVRYAAAFALAQSLPTRPFAGSDRVVPLLVEAVNQTSKPGIVVLAPDSNESLNVGDLRDAVQSLGYPVVAASSPNGAVAGAISLPTVELIIISEDSDVRGMISLEQHIARLQGASVLVLTHTPESPWALASATDLLMNSDVIPPKATLKDELKADIDAAREHSGTAVMSEDVASSYSLQAASLLEKLALTRGHAFDMTVAEGGLLSALNDSRPPIAKAAGKVLATFNAVSAQNGLAMKANNAATPSDVRVSLYESLAESAKHMGNHLDSDAITGLETVVSEGTDPAVRDAAAKARGALDLPADAARTLILKQSRV
jgi:HEAT repeat protein